MAEQPSGNRRTSARLKHKEDVFGSDILEKSKQNGTTKQFKNSGKASITTRSKRKMDYDEDDDGFKFTRAQTKRAKAVPPALQQNDIPQSETFIKKPAARRKSKRKSEEPELNSLEDEETTPRRATRRKISIHPKPSVSPEKQAVSVDDEHMEVEKQKQDIQIVAHEPTKISLPFADTPIIRRNKAMRKGNNEARRSSLGMRGRRASSLIDSGTSNALPHDQVETADFYKHIESTLLEPRRMRQLLMWCGARALGSKPSFAIDDSEVRLAAWQIQQELLKDFASKTELSDWFSREESPAQPRTLKPNPRNVANLAKIEELELKLKELKAEHEQWTILQTRPPQGTFTISPLPAIEELSLSSLPKKAIAAFPALQTLSSSEHTSALEFTSSIQRRLNAVKTSFELNLDKLLDSVNHLGQNLASAEITSKHVLSQVAKVLDEKDRRVVEKEGTVGAMDTLKALTRVIDQG